MGAGFSREQLENYAKEHNLNTDRNIRDYADSELYELKDNYENKDE